MSEMYLKMEPVKGDCNKAKYKDQIEIAGFSWSNSNTGSMHSGDKGAGGTAIISDLMLSKKMDKSSPTLSVYCNTGEHIKEAVLTCTRTQGKDKDPLEYLVMTLTDVMINTYSTSGVNSGDLPMENFSLNFGKIHMVFTPQDNDGNPQPKVQSTYNVVEKKNA